MKDFLLDENGDIVLKNGTMRYVSGKELVIQKIRTILGTNLGEWEFDEGQGIDFHVFWTKNPNKDQIIDTILLGLRQVDETLEITEYKFETSGRKMVLRFTARSASVEAINLVVGEAQGGSTALVVCEADADTVLAAGNAIDAIAICTTDCDVYSG